jgi:hypothetical protein
MLNSRRPSLPPILTDHLLVQLDDGGYQIGLHDDAPGPFPSRAFAQAVATTRRSRVEPVQRRAVSDRGGR